jgi:hypothetical protein
MKIHKYLVVVFLSFCFLFLFTVSLTSAQIPKSPYSAANKKIITLQGYRYWDWSSDLKNNLEKMQVKRPYMDGVIFHTGKVSTQPNFAFNDEVLTEESLHFDDLQIIKEKSTRFTDNFIWIWGHAQNTSPDFFNDSLWNIVGKNAELMGKAVKTAGCKGIMFDPEFYSSNDTYSPWWYGKSGKFSAPYIKAGKSFKEVQFKARQRGKEYILALQKFNPKITILTTFLYSYVWAYCYNDIQKLPDSEYSLLSAFADGMLDGLNKNSILIDGNETSYYINESRKYVENSDQADYKFCRFDAPEKLCDSATLVKWHTQGQIAMAPYLEYCYNRYSPKSWSKPEYQSKWMAHNVYNSLLATDQYVWIYIEGMDFWKGTNLPEGVDVFSDINTAIAKFKNGLSLGYDMVKPVNEFEFNGEKPSQFIDNTMDIKLKYSYKTKKHNEVSITSNLLSDTNILKVEYYLNSIKIGSVVKAPYSIESVATLDSALVFARIFLNDGKHITSAPLIITNLKKKKGK